MFKVFVFEHIICGPINDSSLTLASLAVLEVILDLSPSHIVMKGVAHAIMHKLTRKETGGGETLCDRIWSSGVGFVRLLSLLSDEMIKA